MDLRTKAVYGSEANDREKRNLNVAYRAATEGIVLLENNGALPFKGKKTALFGAGAAMTIKGGTGSGEVNSRHSVSILEGLENRGFEVTTKGWIDEFDLAYAEGKKEYDARVKKAMLKLKISSIMDLMFSNYRCPEIRRINERDIEDSKTDNCIYVLSRQAGEGSDRSAEEGDYLVSCAEAEDIKKCAESYKNFVLIINCGSPMDLAFTEQIDGIDAILYICQPGDEGGNAVADIVSGAVTPSGRLADTWAKNYTDIPFADEFGKRNGNLENEYYKEGIYVGYRYFDSFGVEPRYPFGYGKSYTDFEIKPLSVKAEKSEITVTASVKNTGKLYTGREVVQLYVSAPAGGLDKEYQSLAAFVKTKDIDPGEKEECELKFNLSDCASYRESDGCFVLEPGSYLLRLGSSSRENLPCAVAVLDGEAIVSRHEHICKVREPIEELKAAPSADAGIDKTLPRVSIKASDIKTEEFIYEKPAVCSDERVQSFMKGLSLSDMAEIVVGIGMFGGVTAFTLPGSVGNTTSKFWNRGLANIALCDGPAGLRLQKRSGINKKGAVKPVDLALSIFEMFPNIVQKFMKANPDKDTIIYQFATAFPVTAALAQSWNRELLYEVGNAVGEEMEEYGCTFWLAPAINIHRNPLCGRNFEYYSEDPFLTGNLCSQLIKGVQKHYGCYVTVKHFACNNQEDNRNQVSSNLSERALREIYLRGFETAVRDGGAKGMMTSYNRVNGVYTANSGDLCTKVLRNEWGFDGVVMTDWFSTNKGQADNALAMSAGNDMIMPGGGNFKKAIVRGVKKGLIEEQDLRRCCANVLKAIFDSATQKEYIK